MKKSTKSSKSSKPKAPKAKSSKADLRTNLLLAIAKARGPCECRYVLGDSKPGCVIGQLARIEGVSLDELRVWDRSARATITDVVEKRPRAKALASKYGLSLLSRLQEKWDTAGVWDRGTTRVTTRRAREKMVKLVDEAL